MRRKEYRVPAAPPVNHVTLIFNFTDELRRRLP
jgi:hypothetical protein